MRVPPVARTRVAVRDACPDCGGELVGVEYAYGSPNRYDGVSEWACRAVTECGYRVGRWTGKRLTGTESEPRFGIDALQQDRPSHVRYGAGTESEGSSYSRADMDPGDCTDG